MAEDFEEIPANKSYLAVDCHGEPLVVLYQDAYKRDWGEDMHQEKKIASLASGRTRRSGRFRRNLLNSDADRHGTVRPDAVRHGICLPDGAW